MADTQDALPSDAGSPTPPGGDSGVTGAIWGDFTIERKIGGGGMGAVYLARQAGLDRKVALKVLPSLFAESAEYRQRFAAEAKAAGRISSPNVVGVYACGEHAGRLWYAMEYVEGQDLAARLKAGWHPEWHEALKLCAQAARGLAAAHRLGLVHRDIKPANLILALDGTLKVADFGLVRGRQDSVTTTGAVIGTMTYIAPEQASGSGACDHRADLYALGCVLYELLCRRPPFTGENMAALIAQHLQATPFPPSRHSPWLPRAVDDLVMRLLAKKPEERPADAIRLANELERLSQAKAAGAKRGSALPLIAIVLLAGAAGGWWWWRGRAAEPAPAPSPVPAPVAAPKPPTEPPKPTPTPVPPPKPPEEEPVVSYVPPPKPAAPVRDIAKIEQQAAALIASGEHLGPVDDLRKRLGPPDLVDHQGGRELWAYGRYTFVVEDGLVLNAKKH